MVFCDFGCMRGDVRGWERSGKIGRDCKGTAVMRGRAGNARLVRE